MRSQENYRAEKGAYLAAFLPADVDVAVVLVAGYCPRLWQQQATLESNGVAVGAAQVAQRLYNHRCPVDFA